MIEKDTRVTTPILPSVAHIANSSYLLYSSSYTSGHYTLRVFFKQNFLNSFSISILSNNEKILVDPEGMIYASTSSFSSFLTLDTQSTLRLRSNDALSNMLNTEDLHAMIVNEGSEISFTEEVSQNQIRLNFVPLHCSTSETILYYCFARSSSCHSVRFLVSALSWFNPFA